MIDLHLEYCYDGRETSHFFMEKDKLKKIISKLKLIVDELESEVYSDINCTDAADIISRLNAHENMNNQVKVELIEVIQEATPDCPWDAND